jgi:DNA-binding transcriptional LysR family regulator
MCNTFHMVIPTPSVSRNNQLNAKSNKGYPVNWNQVFYFSEVAACGSLKDAAVKLNLHPSTLSEHITQLEADLKTELFLRQHRKLVLTVEGNRLYIRAKEMFEAGQRLIDVVAPIPLGCYPVSIGLVPSPSIQIAYQVIGDFLELNGPLNMKLFHAGYSELDSGISKGDFDFGFSDRVSDLKNLSHRLISSSYIKFYVSGKWAETRFSKLLESLPLLICNAEPSTRTLSEQALIEADLVAPAVITSDYPSVLVDLCKRGLGIGVFSEETIKNETEALKAFRVPKDAPRLQDKLYAIWSRDGGNREIVKQLTKLIPIDN